MLGPHFYYDLVRLARRGWPTWLRVLYLGILLISLTLMHQTQPGDVSYQLAEQADRGHRYAMTILVLQNVLILLLLPVYVGGAIAEDKENRTLEALFLTHLTDHEMALGKLGARLLPVAAIVAAGFPLLTFFHLYGNVPMSLLVYHEVNSLLLLLLGGSICLWRSTRAETVFQAISGSYPILLPLGVYWLPGAIFLPWIIGAFVAAVQRVAQPLPWYLTSLALIVPVYVVVTAIPLTLALRNLARCRLEEQKRPQRLTAALALTDNRQPAPAQRMHRARSRIHPLARTIHGNALFWKECLKDGTTFSLTVRWLLVAVAVVVIGGVVCRVGLYLETNPFGPVRGIGGAFAYSFYFLALAAYVLLVLFQTTLSVAGEREQDTLDFLLMIPEDRPAILFNKWLGPLWRNWPVLAVSYFGALLGLAGGVYGPRTALMLFILPWPLLLLLDTLALWLSVVCRRVLFANIILIASLAGLVMLQVATWGWFGTAVQYDLTLLFEFSSLRNFGEVDWDRARWLALGQQAVFLLLATAFGILALRRFRDGNG
jgi:ABC-type Na+ efflux pump permease subunit